MLTLTRTSTVLSAAIAASLGSVLLLAGGCQNRQAQATPPTTNTAVLCPAFVDMANKGHNKVGNALFRETRAADKAAAAQAVAEARSGWNAMVAATRAFAVEASDPGLKADLSTLADGMALISADPAGLEHGMQELEKSQPASFGRVQAASDRLEATCGKITGIVPGEQE